MTKQNIFLLIGGLLLLWGVIWFGLSQNEEKPTGNEVVNTDDYEVVQVGHDGRSLVPAQVVLQAGKNYDIQITPSNNGIGCMVQATAPTLGRETYRIQAGKTFSIKVANARPGTYPVICTSMGMKQGDIVVQG